MGVKPPGMLKMLFGVLSAVKNEPMQKNCKVLISETPDLHAKMLC